MADEATKPAADTTKADDQASAESKASPAEQPQAAEGEATEGKPSEGALEQKTVVPEKYDLKLPEGSALKPEHIEKVSLYAKEKGLSQEQAQALLERENAAVADFAQAQKAQLEEAAAKWTNEVKSDKELGGETFNQNVELAKRVIDRFGSDVLKKTLDDTGLGNHPELVRVFVRIGKEMAEDKLVLPRVSGAEGKKSAAELLYPSSKQ